MSQVCVHFCLHPYALFTLSLLYISFILLHLLSTNHKITHPCYFPLLLKHCCSEGEDGMEFFDEGF
jgi:hypothetical protein